MNRFSIVRSVKRNRWELIDSTTKKMIAFSQTYKGAARALGAIESPCLEAIPLTGFRETLRIDHLAKVVAEQVRRRETI